MLPLISIVLIASLLAWGGERWSLRLPHYEQQRRAIPNRTLVTVGIASVAAAIAVWQGESLLSSALLALWSVVFALVLVVDIETHFIPNQLILPATGLALLLSAPDPRLSWQGALLGAAVGFVVFYVIAVVTRGGFGMGDAKLAAFMGAVTGFPVIIYALLAGIFAGGLGAILLLGLKLVTRRTFMPYGPYLCFGGWLGALPAVAAFWGMGQGAG